MKKEFFTHLRCTLRAGTINFAVKVFTPLARILLNEGVTCRQAMALYRWVCVHIMARHPDFHVARGKPSNAHIAARTGLSRRAVQALLATPSPHDINLDNYCNQTMRVLTAWTQDARFHDQNNKPKTLPFTSVGTPSFSDLVGMYAADIPPRIILEELSRIGAVKIQDANGNDIPANKRRTDIEISFEDIFYLPSSGTEELLNIVAKGGQDLLGTIAHNLKALPDQRRLQRDIWSPRVSASKVAELESLLHDLALQYLAQADELIRQHSDSKARPGVVYHRVGLGAYYFEQNMEDETEILNLDEKKSEAGRHAINM
ncbi:MAG: DUF6502 family protein [Gammaproteobacteria bacterium]|nr:DUF6502 family protein [Gammaproteobacteria bacterium]